MPLYEMSNARTDDQRAEMQRLADLDVCLFCPESVQEYAEDRLVHATERWTVLRNRYPYRGARLHLLLVPRTHAADLVDLPAQDQQDFWRALTWVRDEYRLSFYGLAVRCGECARTGGTIEHVHAHVLVGDVEAPDHQPVKVKLSSPAPPGSGSAARPG